MCGGAESVQWADLSRMWRVWMCGQVSMGREDVLGADFVAFRRTGRFDLTGTLNASHSILSTQLNQLEVVVALEASPSAALKTAPLARGFPFFEFHALPEDRYVVWARPNAAAVAAASAAGSAVPALSARTHTFTQPMQTVALAAHTHVTVSFDAEYTAAAASDDGAGAGASIGNPSNPASSLLTLVLAVGVGLALLNRKKVRPPITLSSFVPAAHRLLLPLAAGQSVRRNGQGYVAQHLRSVGSFH
jgi:hypothetical protein